MHRIGRRLSYANVVATLALFVALGGSSYAAAKLGRSAVKSRNIAPNAITGAKVKNHSLTTVDLARGVLKQGATGSQGPKGDPGPAGPAGPAGPKGDAVPVIKYFATVDDNGALKRGTPGTTVAKLGGASPYYTVTFPGSVVACSPVVSAGNNTNNSVSVAIAYARTVAEVGVANQPNVIEVGFSRPTANTAIAAGFSLVVAC